MAIAPTIPNYRLLNQWPLVMGESLWTFNQVSGVGDRAPLSERGKRLYVQPDRDTIADGLLQAAEDIATQTRFYYRPVYITDEIIPVNSRQWIDFQTLETRWKWLKAFGTRATSLIEAGVSVTGTDPDSSSVNQNMTLSVTFDSADDVPSLEEIQVFFTTDDGADAVASEAYEIEPLTKSVSGATVTLKGHRSLFVKPSIWDEPYNEPNYNPENVNYADTETASDFVTSVDVYRVYPDSTGAVQFRIDPATQSDYSDLDTYITFNALHMIVDEKNGYFRTRFSTTACPRYPIDRVKVSYLAGFPLQSNGSPDRLLTQAHVRLANTLMADQPESFTDQRLRKWQGDLEAIAINGQNLTTQNPFGYTRGAQAAWNIINSPRYKIPHGGALGVL